ncbi:MAG: T9SS type A sorting domain-containing protein [Bacteroidales bacterium]|nr:T9SS type A sorting domain-containing protein [Bacteroidales bacterium]
MKNICLLAFTCLLILQSRSQGYQFSCSTSPYAELTGGTDLTAGAPWTVLNYTIPLDFSFGFYGVGYDTLRVRDYLQFDALNLSFAFPFYTKFIDRGASPVRYEITGDSGSRVIRIEWKNMGFWAEHQLLGTMDDSVSFQLWLFEEGNHLEVHTGPVSVIHPDTSYYGKTGPAIGVYALPDTAMVTGLSSVSLSGDPSAPVPVFNDPELDVYLSGTPPEGMVYRFEYSPAGISGYAAQQSLNVFPNPSSGNIFIRNIPEGALIISNFTGVPVMKTVVLSSGDDILLDLSRFSSGPYYLKLISGREVHSGKVMLLK